ncbi:acyltransferase [Chromobacterium vaccinii]|uniref:acyltransferase n=1 Tax=Chromobacterium vaccinii TaxID=1108595 RepID=UPI000B190766|nr:acyltransferase [Chromobacterium vaccinii]
MDQNITISGEGNCITFQETKNNQLIGGEIKIKGNNNKITVMKGSLLNNFSILIESNNNEILIGENCRLSGKLIMKLTDGNRFTIGNKTTIGGANFICGEGKSISIGEDCMIAWGIEFRTTDSHAIINIENNERINFGEDIVVHNHVWIGAHTTILKGASINENTIIGIRSVVPSGEYKGNCIYAGVPAKLIKTNTTWDRKLLG